MFSIEKTAAQSRLEFRQHIIERGGQLTDFVIWTGIIDATIKVTFVADGLGRLSKAVDRA